MATLIPIVNSTNCAFNYLDKEIKVSYFLPFSPLPTDRIRVWCNNDYNDYSIIQDIVPHTVLQSDSAKTQYAVFIINPFVGNYNAEVYIKLALVRDGVDINTTITQEYLYKATSLTSISITPSAHNGDIAPMGNMTFTATPNKITEDIDKLLYCIFILNGQLSEWIYPQNNNTTISYTYVNEFDGKYDEDYILSVLFVTEKGYVYKTENQLYHTQGLITDTTKTLNLQVVVDENKSCNVITVTPSFLLSDLGENVFIKIYSKNEEYIWKEIYNGQLDSSHNVPYAISYYDYLIEANQPYEYKVEIFNDQNNKIVETTAKVINHYEDTFLVSDKGVFRIAYNPKINSYKYNINNVYNTTLGSQYPFSRQVGKMKYRTFQIGGLISYTADIIDNNAFTFDSYFNPNNTVNNTNSFNNTFLDKATIQKASSLDSISKEIFLERAYREKIIDFLQENTIKLFKSEQEGLILIKISNVQLTPNEQLSRHIYSFSAEATEMAEASYENCVKYNVFGRIENLINNNYLYYDYYVKAANLKDEDLVLIEYEGIDSNLGALVVQEEVLEVVSNDQQKSISE